MGTTRMGFWYLATPYRNYPLGLGSAFLAACRQSGTLLKAGIAVYSPIVHMHQIADVLALDKVDNDFWYGVNLPMMDAARGMIFCRLPSWERSQGMKDEQAYFERAGKPVVTMLPDLVPALPPPLR